jgi:hypothetical protein
LRNSCEVNNVVRFLFLDFIPAPLKTRFHDGSARKRS